MCGLVGTAKASGVKAWDDLLAMLLLFDQVRGRDSTGLAKVDYQGNVVYQKKAEPSGVMLANQDFSNFVNRHAIFNIGHNRAATVGSVSDANSHPFQWDNIILTHNGTLRGWWEKELDTPPDGPKTDSAHLAYNFAVNGWRETLCNRELTGAWSLVWHDKQDNKVRFLRNEERPMHIYLVRADMGQHIQGPVGYAWASEEWMLQIAAAKCRFNVIEKFTPKPGELWELEHRKKDNTVHLEKTEEVKFFVPKPYITKGEGGSGTTTSNRTSGIKRKGSRRENHSNNGNVVFLPRRKPRQRKLTEQLLKRWEAAKIGIDWGSNLDVIITELSPSPGQNGRGKAEGYLNAEPWLTAEVHNVALDDIILNEDCVMRCIDYRVEKIHNKGKTYDNIIILLDPSDYYDELERLHEDQETSPAPTPKKGIIQYAIDAFKNGTTPMLGSPLVDSQTVKGPDNSLITKEEFEELTDNGCTVCHKQLYFDRGHEVQWVKSASVATIFMPVCNECMVKAADKRGMKH